MTDAAALVAQLAAAGTPPELLAAVAKELFAGETARTTINERRKKDRERKPHKSEEIHGNPRTSEEIHATPCLDKETSPRPPKEINPIPCERESRPWALPVGVSLQVWTDLLGNRKRKRLGTSATAWKHFNDDLSRVSSQTGIPPPELIEQCTAKGWGAIYDPREQGNGRSAANGMGRNQSNDGLSATTRAALAVFGPTEASH